jgi:hypothetical protein
MRDKRDISRPDGEPGTVYFSFDGSLGCDYQGQTGLRTTDCIKRNDTVYISFDGSQEYDYWGRIDLWTNERIKHNDKIFGVSVNFVGALMVVFKLA